MTLVYRLVAPLEKAGFIEDENGIGIMQGVVIAKLFEHVGTRDSSRTRSTSQTALESGRCIP